MKNEKEIAIEKLQNALLKLPKDDLIKLLKNTYQVMRNKHNIPQDGKDKNHEDNNTNLVANKRNNKIENNKTGRGINGPVSRFEEPPKPMGGRLDQARVFEKRVKGNKNSKEKTNIINKRPDVWVKMAPKNQDAVQNAKAASGQDSIKDLIPELAQLSLGEEDLGLDDDLINKYLNFDDDLEDVTFRSQHVEVPQLDLKPALEYIQNKHNAPGTSGSNYNANHEPGMDDESLNNRQFTLEAEQLSVKAAESGTKLAGAGEKAACPGGFDEELMTPSFSPKNYSRNLVHFDSCSTNSTLQDLLGGPPSEEGVLGANAALDFAKAAPRSSTGFQLGPGNPLLPGSGPGGQLERPSVDRFGHFYAALGAARGEPSEPRARLVDRSPSFVQRSPSFVYQPPCKAIGTSHSLNGSHNFVNSPNYVVKSSNFYPNTDNLVGPGGYRHPNHASRMVQINKNNYRQFMC